MTICNMSIEAGARAGMVAPDETTFAYLKGRPHAPEGDDWDAAVEHWRTLATDEGAEFDAEVVIDADTLEPFVTWGTNPGQGVSLNDTVPAPEGWPQLRVRTVAPLFGEAIKRIHAGESVSSLFDGVDPMHAPPRQRSLFDRVRP